MKKTVLLVSCLSLLFVPSCSKNQSLLERYVEGKAESIDDRAVYKLDSERLFMEEMTITINWEFSERPLFIPVDESSEFSRDDVIALLENHGLSTDIEEEKYKCDGVPFYCWTKKKDAQNKATFKASDFTGASIVSAYYFCDLTKYTLFPKDETEKVLTYYIAESMPEIGFVAENTDE